MSKASPFKWRHFQSDLILLCVRWYLRYSLSYRDLEEMMTERGLSVDHTTIYRWVQHYAPELDRRCRPHLNATTDSWRVDETYVKVKGSWTYLSRAVDKDGQHARVLPECYARCPGGQALFLQNASSLSRRCPPGDHSR
jgi:IS6 family transposase